MRGLCHVALLCVLGAPRVGAFGNTQHADFQFSADMNRQLLACAPCFNNVTGLPTGLNYGKNYTPPRSNSTRHAPVGAPSQGRGRRRRAQLAAKCCPVPYFMAHLFVRCKGGGGAAAVAAVRRFPPLTALPGPTLALPRYCRPSSLRAMLEGALRPPAPLLFSETVQPPASTRFFLPARV